MNGIIAHVLMKLNNTPSHVFLIQMLMLGRSHMNGSLVKPWKRYIPKLSLPIRDVSGQFIRQAKQIPDILQAVALMRKSIKLP